MGPLSILLDTHVFVWALTDSPDLRTSTRKLIAGAENRFVSAVSYWEIATKSRLDKWPRVDACILSRRRLVELGFTPLGLDMRSAHGERRVMRQPAVPPEACVSPEMRVYTKRSCRRAVPPCQNSTRSGQST